MRITTGRDKSIEVEKSVVDKIKQLYTLWWTPKEIGKAVKLTKYQVVCVLRDWCKDNSDERP